MAGAPAGIVIEFLSTERIQPKKGAGANLLDPLRFARWQH
jgi:hypothetical protein